MPREREHRRDLGVGEHHHAAALADPVDRDAQLLRLREHGLQRVRALDRRDLDPPRAAVREPLLRRRRTRLRDVEPEPGERRFSWQWLHVLLLHVNRSTFHDRGGQVGARDPPRRHPLRRPPCWKREVAVEHEVLGHARGRRSRRTRLERQRGSPRLTANTVSAVARRAPPSPPAHVVGAGSDAQHRPAPEARRRARTGRTSSGARPARRRACGSAGSR